MKTTSSSASEAGAGKKVNQDHHLIDAELGLYLVCDGMGGHRGGDIAAQLAGKTTREHLRKHKSEIQALAKGEIAADAVVDLVSAAILAANVEIHKLATADKALTGMGTTIALLLIAGHVGIVAHVGSSRVYLSRNGKFIQLTKDHKLAQELIDKGMMTAEKAATWMYGRVLSRALGLLEAVTVDTMQLDILPGDRFLLTTDGVSGALSSAELSGSLNAASVERGAQEIVRAAHSKELEEDVTAIVVEPVTDEGETRALQQRVGEVNLKTDTLREMFLFRRLDDQSIVRLVRQSSITECGESQVLFKQGDREQNIYIVLEGCFDVIVDDSVIAQLGRGNHFGEMSWFTHEPRSATIRAAARSRLLQVNGEALQRLIKVSPEIGVVLLQELAIEMSSRLRATNALVPPSK